MRTTISNLTKFKVPAINRIIARLSNRLGRQVPRHVIITVCCKERRCRHEYLLTGGFSDPAYLWFPRVETWPFSNRELAYAVDQMMRGQFTLRPTSIQSRVALVRDYAWADALPPVQKRLPPKPRPKRDPPPRLQALQKKHRQTSERIGVWKEKHKVASRARNLALTKIETYQREEKKLLREISKQEALDAANQTDQISNPNRQFSTGATK